MKNPFSRDIVVKDAPSKRPDSPSTAERPMDAPEMETLSVNKPAAPPSAEMPMSPPSAEAPATPPSAEAPATPPSNSGNPPATEE